MDAARIGRRLRELRGERSQATVGMAVGVGGSCISNYELGIRIPADDIKIKLAEYFETTVGELFYSPLLNR